MVVAVEHGYEVRRLDAPTRGLASPAMLDVDFTDVPVGEAVGQLDLLLRNRGLGGVRLADGVDASSLSTLTLSVEGMPPRLVMDYVSRLLGLRAVARGTGFELRADP